MGFTSWVFELPGLFEHGPLSSEVIESLILLWTVNHNITYRWCGSKRVLRSISQGAWSALFGPARLVRWS